MLPRSRDERHRLRHKERLERERLADRTGSYHRYEPFKDPVAVAPGCPSHAAAVDRFLTTEDVASVEQRERLQEFRNIMEKHEGRRQARYKREEDRWQALDAKERAEQTRLQRLQDDPVVGRKNLAGAPFNIVTHAYDGTAAGQKLRHHDDMVKFRGELRTMNLAARNHLGFNPIIGEQVYPIRIPERPHASSMPALAH
mmetsp:Transcript_118169/g.271163  ORF Transcript_118169/g.271163 Transcript_118169/m.271163 type:complete len:199 (+) Transcript_118169:93-689(+)